MGWSRGGYSFSVQPIHALRLTCRLLETLRDQEGEEGIRSAETERTFSPISCELRAGARNEVAASLNLSSAPASEIFITMSNREIVIDLLSKLPEDTSLEEIAREIELLAGIKTAREQTRRGEGLPAEDARKLVDTWAGQ